MPTSKALIIVPNVPVISNDLKIEIAPDLERQKSDLLARCLDFEEAITTIPERDKVLALSTDIATHLKQLEKDRKEKKDPFRIIGDMIDDACRKHRETLEEEKRRLDRAAGAFEHEQQLKREEEARKIERERQRIAAEAEAKRLEAERLAEKPKASATKVLAAQKAADNAEAEAREKQRLLDQQAMEAAEANRKAAAKGGSKAVELDVQVTDIKLLYQFRPDCVRLEPDLTQIKVLHRQGIKLPGVTVTETASYRSRAR